MKKHTAFLSAVGVSMLVCGTLGLIRTRYAALHLLAKNKALIEAGRVALPGNGHLETLASWSPAFAGALFFALALGLGYGAVSYFYGYQWRYVHRRYWTGMAFPLAVLPFMALYRNELDTHLVLVLAGVGGVIFGLKAEGGEAFDKKGALAAGLAALLIAVGFLPWVTAEEGAFKRLRDNVLLKSDALMSVNDFYYRWTLYPAEAIKPVDIRTQPGAAVDEKLRGEFCASAWKLGVVCMPPNTPVYDFIVREEAETPTLISGKSRMRWDYKSMESNAAAFKTFGDELDTSRTLRRSTAVSLNYLMPLALLGSLAWLASKVGEKKRTLTIAAAFVFAALIGYAGMAGNSAAEFQHLANGKADKAQVDAALDSPDPAYRLYGAIAAGKNPAAYEQKLYRALTDPIMNVRYNAALSLGGLRTEEAQKRLLAVVAGDEEWYVKFRAYAALGGMGWMP